MDTQGTNAAALADIDAGDPALLNDPYAYYARLTAEAPVFRDPKTGIVAVSSYKLIQEACAQPAIFSSAMGHLLTSGGAGALDAEEAAIMASGLPWVDTLLTADPPRHALYRRVATKAFAQRRVMAMEPAITATCHELIDRFIGRGHAELKSEFADHLPSTIIADMLGVPRADLPRFADWLHAGISRLSGLAGREQRIIAARKEIELQHYFLAAIADRRENPRDDIITDLVQASWAEAENARPLNDAELYGILQQLFNAGQETTAHSIVYAIYQLFQHPQQLAALRADPALMRNAIEETLRHLSPTNNMWRVVAQDTALGGVDLHAGETMLLRFGAGNRDSAVFAAPDQFDIHRANARDHLSFGHGVHLCLGAALARVEMRAALPVLLERLENLRVGDMVLNATPILRGVRAFEVTFDRK
jgi:cytochrome P450